MRENTERPEAIQSGVARIARENSLAQMLEENYNDETWIRSVGRVENPFGDGRAAKRIVEILKANFLAAKTKKTVRLSDALTIA